MVKVKGKQHIANEFNNFFVNVGPDVAKNIEHENSDIFSYLQHRNANSMFLRCTDKEEV